MNRSLTRATASLAGVALALVGTVALANGAAAAEATPGPLVTVTATPVDPQPVVAGHEGDVLLQVNVVMAAKAEVVKVAKVATSAKHGRHHR